VATAIATIIYEHIAELNTSLNLSGNSLFL